MLLLVISEVAGLVGALGKVLAAADTAPEFPPWFNARTCNVYCVLAVKPVKV